MRPITGQHAIKLLLVVVFILVHCFSATEIKDSDNKCKNCTNFITFNNSDVNATKETSSHVSIFEPRKKEKEQDLMSRILPMMVIPFMVSTAMIPMMLVSLKAMLLKSMLIGKIAVLLMIINMFRSRSDGDGGVFNHHVSSRDDAMSKAYYGYSGDEEYGAYINKKKRKR